MIATLLLMFFAGVFAANAVPHFVKGITRERFPTPFGGSPVVNVTAGWFMFLIAAALVGFADLGRHTVASVASAAVGVLLMSLFHARIGAFGRQ
ncbi:hypothetical protein ACFPIJ_26470 [Dactylosporangium cerinum]|uniref:Integral membrane protein n=1 Tax=Dactylosporangium cerinum TaxID=1434730 RepID=A0ABV9W2Z1_9ACTN